MDARSSARGLVHHALGFLYDWLQVIVRLENILFWFLEYATSGMYPKVPLLLVMLMLFF